MHPRHGAVCCVTLARARARLPERGAGRRAYDARPPPPEVPPFSAPGVDIHDRALAGRRARRQGRRRGPAAAHYDGCGEGRRARSSRNGTRGAWRQASEALAITLRPLIARPVAGADALGVRPHARRATAARTPSPCGRRGGGGRDSDAPAGAPCIAHPLRVVNPGQRDSRPGVLLGGGGGAGGLFAARYACGRPPRAASRATATRRTERDQAPPSRRTSTCAWSLPARGRGSAGRARRSPRQGARARGRPIPPLSLVFGFGFPEVLRRARRGASGGARLVGVNLGPVAREEVVRARQRRLVNGGRLVLLELGAVDRALQGLEPLVFCSLWLVGLRGGAGPPRAGPSGSRALSTILSKRMKMALVLGVLSISLLMNFASSSRRPSPRGCGACCRSGPRRRSVLCRAARVLDGRQEGLEQCVYQGLMSIKGRSAK